MTKMPDEIKDVILQGLTNLMALRLRGAPGSDTVSATATAWIMALSAKPVAWDADLDAGRMKAAFVTLMGSTETWPTPLAFYERLISTPRPRQERIEHKHQGGMSPETRAMIDGCIRKMRAKPQEDENAT